MMMIISLLLKLPRTIMQKNIDFFVFFLDRVVENGNNEQRVLLDRFMSEHRCLILSRYHDKCRQLYPHAQSIKQWQFTLPSPAFQKYVIEDFKTRIESIAYISDDIDFIMNALGSFSTSVFINIDGIKMDYGKLPDFSCRSIPTFINAIDSGHWNFLGEGLIYTPEIKQYRGKLGTTSIICENNTVPIIFAGRYFGMNHYRSYIDFYSMSLRKNKEQKSKLFKRFDALFLRIFRAEVKNICMNQHMDTICSIPDNKTKGQEWGRFAEITSKIANEFGLKDIQSYMKKTKSQTPQKSRTTANDRKENVKDSFKCDINLKGRKVILIDDILTSGSTMRECASTLFAAGASCVIGTVLAVNQFSIDYWDPDTDLKLLQENIQLRGRAKDIKPFFSDKETGKTLSYEQGMTKLSAALNEKILSFGYQTTINDDSFF